MSNNNLAELVPKMDRSIQDRIRKLSRMLSDLSGDEVANMMLDCDLTARDLDKTTRDAAIMRAASLGLGVMVVSEMRQQLRENN